MPGVLQRLFRDACHHPLFEQVGNALIAGLVPGVRNQLGSEVLEIHKPVILNRRSTRRAGYKYFSRAILARCFRISARARKARTLTSATDHPVSSAISFTERSSISSSVMINLPAGDIWERTFSTNSLAAVADSLADAGSFT